jgi:hypothetical protein
MVNGKHALVTLLHIFLMTAATKLIAIKIAHTLIWLFFNVVIFYLAYAVVTYKIDKWVWIGLSCFLVEGIVLVAFKNVCPLTLLARKYSNSVKDNFDIYIPNWLARYNKLIYTSLLALIIIMLAYKLTFFE